MNTYTNDNEVGTPSAPVATPPPPANPRKKRKLSQYVAIPLAEVTAQQLQHSVQKDLLKKIEEEGDEDQTYVIVREVTRVRVTRKTKTTLAVVK